MPVGRFFQRRWERRRSPRIDSKGLAAYYWTGAVPSPRHVHQIGLHGAHIVAADRFYPGTLVQMVLEDRSASGNGEGGHPHVCVQAEVLRSAADGFCVAFLFGEAADRKRFRLFFDQLRRRAAEEPKPGQTNEAENQNEAKGRNETEFA